MSTNIVLLSGSPRKGGNTDKLAAAFTEGARSAGKSVTLFQVAEQQISGCLGCGYCTSENNVCIQEDDMPYILEALKKADTLVLASPIYFFTITAQLKLAIDRTYALLRDKPPINKAALLLTCGDKDGGAAEGAIVMFKRMCAYLKWEDAGVILATGLHYVNDIDGREELGQAAAFGREI